MTSNGSPGHQVWVNEFGKLTRRDDPATPSVNEEATSETPQLNWLNGFIDRLLPTARRGISVRCSGTRSATATSRARSGTGGVWRRTNPDDWSDRSDRLLVISGCRRAMHAFVQRPRLTSRELWY
jgi:hypothetical protein